VGSALVYFRGANTQGFVGGFDIHGPANGTCVTRFYGVRIDGSAKATVSGNKIRDIRDAVASNLGCQSGNAVQVGTLSGGPGTGNVSFNVIDDYQKNGVTVNEPGTNGKVYANWISGFGPSQQIAQNGIQFGFNSTGEAAANIIKDNEYTFDTFDSAGVLLTDLDGPVKVAYNAASDNDVGVLAGAVSGTTIASNWIRGSANDGLFLGTDLSFFPPLGDESNGAPVPSTDNTVYGNDVRGSAGDGIAVQMGSTANRIKNNSAFENGDTATEYDCLDGNGNDTSNQWIDNRGETSNPPGLCKPKDGHHGGDDDDDDDHDDRLGLRSASGLGAAARLGPAPRVSAFRR
jgi:parallel beta-helix repeat protein